MQANGWTQDVFLLAAGNTYVGGTSGGEAAHKLTLEEMPKHTHKDGTNPNEGIYAPSGSTSAIVYYSASSYASRSTTETGGDAAHNNMPPYIVVYVWKRVS